MLPHRIRLFIISLATVATACSNSHQTVEWYLAHQTERDAKLKWCNDDMSRATDVDCLNATKAKERAMLSGPSAADSFHFNANKQTPEQSTTPAKQPAAPASETKSQDKPQGKSAADTFQFKPDQKLFPNATKENVSK